MKLISSFFKRSRIIVSFIFGLLAFFLIVSFYENIAGPTIRYESNNWLTYPFVLGVRHFQLAFCDGSQETLFHLAKERIIYRPMEKDNAYATLTTAPRIYHITVGTLETAGYVTLIVPFITAAADRFFNKLWYPKGGYSFETHMEEGGTLRADKAEWRKNPFDQNGVQDPFYQGASWLPKTK